MTMTTMLMTICYETYILTHASRPLLLFDVVAVERRVGDIGS
jgi:hypothetical protein